MTSYSPIGQLTGTFSRNIGLGDKIPWLYVVASLSKQVIFVGETFDDGGLLTVLAQHLGTMGGSAMLAKADELDIGRPDYPHVIVAARLPIESDPAEFDGTAPSTREQCLATLQAKIAERFVASRAGWTDLTTVNGAIAREGSAIEKACEAIFEHTASSINMMSALSRSIPLHLVILDPYPIGANEVDTLDGILHEIEVKLHGWMVGKLRSAFGASWWSKGIPVAVRSECAARREYDGGDHSINLEAYMMFIDLAAIAKANWNLTSQLMEQVAGRQGKDAGSSWLSELNELRKIVAHPIRGKYVKAPLGSVERAIDLRTKLNAAIAQFPMGDG